MRPMSEEPASNPTETETKAENAIIEFKITLPGRHVQRMGSQPHAFA